MRTDHQYEPLKMTATEKRITRGWRPGDAWSYAAVLETRDAPPEVLDFCERRLAHREEWEAGAKDRPITVEPQVSAYGRVRLFDGPWIDARAIPGAVEANFPIELPISEAIGFPSEAKVYMRHVATPWEALEELAQADDEEGCRRVAAAMYEYLELRGLAARTLVGTVNDEQKRHRLALVRCPHCRQTQAKCEASGCGQRKPVPS